MPWPATLLRISPIGLPPFSARGVTETIKQTDSSVAFRRDINGTLVDTIPQQLKKFAFTITCTDMDSPAVNGSPIGWQVIVDMVNEMAFITAGGSAAYPAVPGSTRTDGIWTYFRPRVPMTIVGFQIQKEENARVIAWELALEETG